MPLPKKIEMLIAALLLAGPIGLAKAQSSNCTGLLTRHEGLSCQAHKRRAYGSSLERTLTHSGFDASVFVEEVGDAGSGAYPRLIIWTFVAHGKVHEINDKAKVLEEARQVGFRMLVYVDKGEDSNWYYDLTKPAAAALDVVPWQVPPWKRENLAGK